MRSGRRIRSRPFVRQAYPIGLVRELAARHGIPPDKAKELQDELQFAAELGLSWGDIMRKRARLRPERKRQAKRRECVARRLAALVSCLVADPETLKSLLFEIELQASERGADLCLPSSKKLRESLEMILPIIEPVQEKYERAYSSGKRGVMGNLELNMFVSCMVRYYDDNIARFKLDYHQGRPLTKSFDFLRDAAKPLFGECDTQIITAARSAIAELGHSQK